jgi:multiple sugar transport system permease protein
VKQSWTMKVFLYGIAGLWIIFAAFPMYWVIIGSLKSYSEMYSKIPTFFPHSFTLSNFAKMSELGFYTTYLNTIKVTLIATGVGVLVALISGYSLMKIKFPGQKTIARSILIAYLVPESLLVIPLYKLIKAFFLFDTHIGLILAYISASVPYCTWMMMGYFKSVPDELVEAAVVEGSSHLTTLRKIMIPVVSPGIVATIIYSFVIAWNELLYPMIFVVSQHKYLAPVRLVRLVQGDTAMNWQYLMAGSTFMVIPPVILFVLLQRFVVQGLSAGSVKG